MHISDADLINRIITGEKHLFEEIIQRYQKSIYNLAYRMLRNREDAMDLTQETFLKAYRGLKTFDLERPFSPWVHRIASNLCVNQYRKRKVQTVPLINQVGEGQEEGLEREIADLEYEPGEKAVQKERQQDLLILIQELPEKYRTPLILRHLHNYTYEEIGQVLEVPPGTVKTWIYRGRNQLKDLFKKKLDYKEGGGR